MVKTNYPFLKKKGGEASARVIFTGNTKQISVSSRKMPSDKFKSNNNLVELTKIHYFHENHAKIPTISREIFDNQFNANIQCKKRVLGQHKWILKINEIQQKNKSKQYLTFVFLLLLALLIAFFLFYFYVKFGEIRQIHHHQKYPPIKTLTKIPKINRQPKTSNVKKYCPSCTSNGICLKLHEVQPPQCLAAIDSRDPTGCGGHCKLSVEYCKLLDIHDKVYQCLQLPQMLQCPPQHFNCGNRCIDIRNKCDGIVNCSNQSDERHCNQTTKKVDL